MVINSLQSNDASQELQAQKWISTVMACIFAVQWTFTMLPHTLIVRNAAFALGAILGTYIIAKNYRLLFQKKAAPIWLILLLFIWVVIHLVFIGKNHDLQMAEFQSLWKRAALGVIFAIGLGISVTQNNQLRDWRIIIIGLCMPVIIYFVKYLSTYYLPDFGLMPPVYLRLFYGSEEFYVAKIAYVFFCLPLLAVALGVLAHQLKSHMTENLFARWFWAMTIIAVMSLFICENIKNGIMYVLLLIAIFLGVLLKEGIHRVSKSNLIIAIAISLIGAIFVTYNLRTNPSWGTFTADFEVALQTSPSDVWESGQNAKFIYPNNKYGLPVSVTNFDRVFYGCTGLQLLEKNLLGYGLVQSSFGHLAKERWPNAPLIQSHSGWLDLMLGLGVPGALLLLTAGLLAVFNATTTTFPWSVFGGWGLGSILLLYITTEVAQKNYVDTFVWFIALVASMALVKSRTDSNTSMAGT